MDEEVYRVNQLYVEEYTSAIVLVIIVIVIGLTGNVFAVVYYGWKAQKSVAQFFILCLSLNDAVTNVVIISDIVDLFNTVNYRSAFACKLFSFLQHWFIGNSLLFMLAIAIERYKRVCYPFSKQLTIRSAQILLAGLFIFAFVSSVRYFRTEGIVRNKLSPDLNATRGYYCALSEDSESQLVDDTFTVFDICTQAIIIVILIVLYTLITRKVVTSNRLSHVKLGSVTYRKKDKAGSSNTEAYKTENVDLQTDNTSCTNEEKSQNIESPRDTNFIVGNSNQDGKSGAENKPVKNNLEYNSIVKHSVIPNTDTSSVKSGFSEIKIKPESAQENISDQQNETETTVRNEEVGTEADVSRKKPKSIFTLKRTLSRQSSVSSRVERRITIMVTVITAASIACFVPYYYSALIVEGNMSGNGFILTEGEVILRRSYMLNSAINPFIMAIFNEAFRRFAKDLFLCREYRKKKQRCSLN